MPANEVVNALVASVIVRGGAIVRTFGTSAATIDGFGRIVFTVSDEVGRPGSAELVVQGSAAIAAGLDAALMVRDFGTGTFEAVVFDQANIVPDVATLSVWRVRTGS